MPKMEEILKTTSFYPPFLDFEIATRNKDLCAVAWIELVDGEVVSKKKYYINPEAVIEPQYQRIHGIKQEDVVDKENFKVIWDNELSKYFDGTYILVAHNTQGSEIDDICKNATKYDLNIPRTILFYDTKKLAEQNNEKHVGLPDLAKDYGIPYDEHNPLEDAEACMKMFIIYNEMGILGEPIEYDTALRENNLQKKSNRVSFEMEIDTKRYDYTMQSFPDYLRDKRVCVSGLFSIGEDEVVKICKENGCSIKTLKEDMKKCNTDYIIVGKPNPLWKDGIGNKKKGYLKFKAKGYDIKEITEEEFYSICGIELK